MAARMPRLPSHRLLALLAVITVGLVAALAWLGWRLIQQDRALEVQRARDQLDRAATVVATELDRELLEVQRALERAAELPPAERHPALARLGDSLGAGALLATLGSEGVQEYPAASLVFDPSRSTAADVFDPAFQAAEQLEFQRRDLPGAIAAYQALARSTDAERQAGALLRLGRTQRKAGELRAALATYDRLAGLGNLALAGRPVALTARHARLDLYQELGQRDAARSEAVSLLRELLAGEWRLSRGSFEFYSADLRKRLGAVADSLTGLPAAREAVALALALDSLQAESALRGNAGRRLLTQDSLPILASWASAGVTVVWLAAPRFVSASWLAALEPLLEREGVRVSLLTPSGAAVATQIAPESRPIAVRGTDATGLPWTLSVASRDPARLAGAAAARRRLLLAGLVVAALLGLVGTFAVARAVRRELEVARVQSDFVAAVSHEFRTPLTSLRQLSELLASERVPGEERRRSYYELMRRESLRLQRLVEGLLDFGRMEAGAHEFRFEPLEAGELVHGVIRDFGQEAGAQPGRITLEGRADCRIRADREALRLALWNLLDNASKYSPEDQPVTVTLARANGRLAISVQDRGPGIAPDEQEKVFEKFIRGQRARAAGIRGTGLGLAMVRRIARAHGGEVTLRSTPGQGSTFTLALPVTEAAE